MLPANSPLVYKIRYSERGFPFGVWEPEVPRIPANVLNSSIYLYQTIRAARDGRDTGGSGFLLGVPSEYEPGRFHSHLYAVTNRHVAADAGVIRLNTKDGGTDILKTEPDSWFHHPAGDDLAVFPFSPSRLHQFSSIEYERIVAQSMIPDSVAPGMEAFLVGRFVGREGHLRNTPTARVGNIAQLPGEPFSMPDDRPREMFLLDMRTIGGSSGSPVLVYVQGMQFSGGPTGFTQRIVQDWRLLGVNWGYIIEDLPVLKQRGKKDEETKFFVRGNSGIALVVPAWKLAELLDIEPLKELRARTDWLKRNRPRSGTAAPCDS